WTVRLRNRTLPQLNSSRSNDSSRWGYCSRSISRSSTTSGVIQPAQSFVRGNSVRSRTRTSSPACTSFHAQVEPAGPPPTTMTSACCTGRLLRRRQRLVLVAPRPRHVVVAVGGEQHLVELQRAVAEGRDRKSTRLNSSHVKISYAVFC